MSGYADTIRRIEAWMERARAEGFEYCCETAEENGLTYEVLAALLDKLVEQADRIAWLEGEVAGWRIKLAECEEQARG